MIRVGHLEHVAAVGLEGSLLLRVPVLARDPARALGRKAQLRPLHVRAGEDAVAGLEVLVEIPLGNILRLLVEQRRRADRVEREAAHTLRLVAPRIDVPVAAVVDQVLGRESALGFVIPLAVVVADGEALALEHGGSDSLEVLELRLACRLLQHVDAPLDLFRGVVALVEDRAQPLEQRLHVRREQARLQGLEQMLHGEQRVGFRRREPQARQLEARGIGVEPVAVRRLVPLDRRLEAVAQVFEVALEGGGRNLELFEKDLARHTAPLAQQALDCVEPLGALHEIGVRPPFPASAGSACARGWACPGKSSGIRCSSPRPRRCRRANRPRGRAAR